MAPVYVWTALQPWFTRASGRRAVTVNLGNYALLWRSNGSQFLYLRGRIFNV